MRNSKDQNSSNCASIIGISPHRLGTDGNGITTLVAFDGCPLRCKFCLNRRCWEPEDRFKQYTPQLLYNEVKIDELYFHATSGGVTFGGGEPCLQADFIAKFRHICGSDWKLRVETSLNVERAFIKKLAPAIDEWIIDIKAWDNETYEKYTGVNRKQMIDNLNYLVSKDGLNIPKNNIYLRVPIIPGYVDEDLAEKAYNELVENQKFPNVEVFCYVTEDRHYNPVIGHGKRVCELLKDIRREVAIANGLDFTERNCSYKGDCLGTCPACENETASLLKQLDGKTFLSNSLLPQKIKMDFANNFKLESQKDIILKGDIEQPLMGLEVSQDWEPEYRFKEVFFKECAVAGLSFHLKKNDELWDELEVGTELALIRDKNNKFDSNAVAVALADDYDGDADDFDFDFILGYIPLNDNSELAAMMDAGYSDKFSAKITTYNRYGSYNNRIRITIYIQSSERELIRPNRLRAESISLSDLKSVAEELVNKGTTYLRFGGYSGFPPTELQFPIEGEKIVIVYSDTFSVILYLMRVLATGDECAKYVDDPETIHCIDDCAPYILTNVMGPVKINKHEWPFLSGVNMRQFSATEYLSLKLSAGFKGIFKKQLFKTLNINDITTDTTIDK